MPMAEFEQLDAPRTERAPVVAAPTSIQQAAASPLGGAGLLRLQALAGNQAVGGLIVQRQAVQQGGPYATQEEAGDVTALMPVMPAIDALVAVTEPDCVKWNAWRSTMQGDVPGHSAFVAMSLFTNAIRAEGFDYLDPRIQAVVSRRLTGDNRQLLTEMCSFAFGAKTWVGGDSVGLAQVFGVQSRPLMHRYTLNVTFSIGPKRWAQSGPDVAPEQGRKPGEFIGRDPGVSVAATARFATITYGNDFGMKYQKLLGMFGLGASMGPGLGGSTFTVGTDTEGSHESYYFWQPEDFETAFSTLRIAINGYVVAKGSVKFVDLIRVTSDKHPPLLFNNMGDKTVALVHAGFEAGYGIGASVDQSAGWMTGLGDAVVTTPTLDEAREIAELRKLVPPPRPGWEMFATAIVPFDTASSKVTGHASTAVLGAAKSMESWHMANPDDELRVDIEGRASPRWRHPEQGQIPDDLNLRLSEERARNTKAALKGALWAGVGEIDGWGVPGPVLELDEERTKDVGDGTLRAKAELAVPDNDDAQYRIALITVWAKKTQQPAP